MSMNTAAWNLQQKTFIYSGQKINNIFKFKVLCLDRDKVEIIHNMFIVYCLLRWVYIYIHWSTGNCLWRDFIGGNSKFCRIISKVKVACWAMIWEFYVLFRLGLVSVQWKCGWYLFTGLDGCFSWLRTTTHGNNKGTILEVDCRRRYNMGIYSQV